LFEQVRETLRYPTHIEYAFHVNPHRQDHIVAYDHLSDFYVPPILSDYYGSSDHDVRNCTYTENVDATCVRLVKTRNELIDKMIETMKEQIVKYSHCFNQSKEDINLHDLDPCLGSLEPTLDLHDDFESFI